MNKNQTATVGCELLIPIHRFGVNLAQGPLKDVDIIRTST
jgi:hypothetical protein